MNLLTVLEARCREAGTAEAIAASNVDLAIYRARAGHREPALSTYVAYHDCGNFGANTALACKLMLLRGLIYYFCESDHDMAFDRVRRAFEIADVVGDKGLISLVGAWLGHLSFNLAKYDVMQRAVSAASSHLSSSDHEICARLNLIAADGAALVGNFDRALVRYQGVKRHAEIVGDSLTIAALMYNRSTMALSHCRIAAAKGERASERALTLVSEVVSARNYEDLLGVWSAEIVFNVWRGRLAMLHGQYSDAVTLLEPCIDRPERDDSYLMALRSTLVGDLALCYSSLGRSEEALHLLRRTPNPILDSRLHSDEKVVLLRQVESVLREAGDLDGAGRAQQEYMEHVCIFDAEVAELSGHLELIEKALN